ncbi:hypothetical protein H0H81_012315 [Sphagnurus paluster]|uniref:Protein kinase domain-containing protein n=1 Tax=Sphagnurus paluster TaxID=117069 RepID=A0A9P7GH06_9AGAR|nr:hypothetical protein H0H81_012315 [Sphagnurus paluster]
MPNDKVFFFVLVANQIIQALDVDPDFTVVSLLQHMKSSRYVPSTKLQRMKSPLCNFYSLVEPVEMNEENLDIAEIMASLKDESKYTKLGHNKLVRNIADNFFGRFLYLVIQDPHDYEEMIVKLKEHNADLYRCLEIKVKTAKGWTKEDILLNGGIRVVDGDTTKCSSWKIGCVKNDLSSIGIGMEEDPVAVKNSREFFAFYSLLCGFDPDAGRYKTAASSSLKAHALKANFVLSPFFSGRDSDDNLLYKEEMPLKFPLFVSLSAMSELPRKYTPASDFSVWFRQLSLPLIIAEVVPKKEKQDRYRMLVQAISLARLAFHLRRPGSTAHPFIVSIYMTAGMIVKRYILMQTESTSEVYFTQRNFDVTSAVEAVEFQREMFNLVSELESIVDELDGTKYAQLEAMKNAASGVMSLHSNGARTATERTRITTMDAIDEVMDEAWDEDDLGVFDNDEILADLAEMNCSVAYVAFGHPNIAPIQSLTDGQLAGCLKFVKDGGDEVEILQHLAGLNFEANHTVRPIRTWPIPRGTIIAMPSAGNRLTKLDDKDTFLWPVMKQLFEAVKFMHDNCVAHMDLKPSNLLIPSEYGTLTVIDFGVSVRVKKLEQLFQSKSRVGTEGYIAPEVGRTKFSPIRADLWSVGKVVEEFCILCRPSASRDWLLGLSKRLLDDDFKKRPMMTEVLQEMLNYGVVETPVGDGYVR